MGIEVKDLFCIHPDFARVTRHVPRARSPRVNRLRTVQDPPPPDEIAQVLLEEMIVSDPQWIQECAPARAKMWEFAQASHTTRARFSQALKKAGFIPAMFWDGLAHLPRAGGEVTMTLSPQQYELIETLEKTAASEYWTIRPPCARSRRCVRRNVRGPAS